jgi:hypothetical protein
LLAPRAPTLPKEVVDASFPSPPPLFVLRERLISVQSERSIVLRPNLTKGKDITPFKLTGGHINMVWPSTFSPNSSYLLPHRTIKMEKSEEGDAREIAAWQIVPAIGNYV